jgi:hypothetical protein
VLTPSWSLPAGSDCPRQKKAHQAPLYLNPYPVQTRYTFSPGLALSAPGGCHLACRVDDDFLLKKKKEQPSVRLIRLGREDEARKPAPKLLPEAVDFGMIWFSIKLFLFKKTFERPGGVFAVPIVMADGG